MHCPNIRYKRMMRYEPKNIFATRVPKQADVGGGRDSESSLGIRIAHECYL